MVDQRVAAEKQNGVGTPYIPPMTRRLQCRIDPEQSPYTCMLPEHKPVRRGREMIDLLAVEEPKPKPAKIRAVSYEAAIDQLFNRMRSSRSAQPNKRSVLPGARYPTKGVAVDRHMADGRERQVSGHQRLAVRRQLAQKTDPDAGRLLGVVLEAVVPVGVVERDLEHEIAGERQPVAAGRQADHAVPGGVAAGALDDHARRHLILVLERPQLAVVLFQEPLARPPKRVREPRR